MFELTDTFMNEEIGFSITPIFMENKGFIFLLQELQVQLGYDDLPNMIKISDSFLEGVEYLTLRNGHLREIKEILHAGSQSLKSLDSIYHSIKFAPSLMVLTESGLYTCIILSRKPNAQAFRRWVTCEVLPSIRETGIYRMPGIETVETGSGLLLDIAKRITSLERTIAYLSHMIIKQEQFQQYALQGFDRIEAVLSETLPHNMFEGYEKIRWLVDKMTEMYQLSEHERRRYTRELCQTHGVQLPEKALLESGSLFHDAQELAAKIGVYSTGNKPHSRLVGALIRHLGLDDEKYCRKFPVVRRGYTTTVPKYSDTVVPYIAKWLQEWDYPETIELDCGDGKSRKFQVKYRIR